MKLYEISNKYAQAISKIDQAETEEEYYLAETELSALDAIKDEKLDACCGYIKNLLADQDLVEREIERLKIKLNGAAARAERFRAYVGGCIPIGERWQRGAHAISWRRSEAVTVINLDEVPPEYLREVLSYEVDKRSSKTAIQLGQTIPGLRLDIKQNLQIK